MMNEISCRLLVVGAGPGGYVCAIRAGQLGVDTVVVDAGQLGGTCLNVGCIPSKAIIHVAEEYDRNVRVAEGKSPFGLSLASPGLDMGAAVAWKDGIVARLNTGVGGLLKKAGVRVVKGRAHFRDGRTVEVDTGNELVVVKTERVVIATGSVPAQLPAMPFGKNVLSSTEALSLGEVPPRLVVVGGGYIGLELGTAFRKLGANVTIVEAQSQVLPNYDKELVGPVEKRLTQLGLRVMTGSLAEELSSNGTAVRVRASDGREEWVEFDKALVTVGRVPALADMGLDNLVLDMNGRHLRINDRCETTMRGVYAIGDVTGEPMLAHRAMAQGEMVAEIVAGRPRAWDKRCIPTICFTAPEVVSAGMSPEDAARAGLDVNTAQFPFAANGRAMTLVGEQGFVRITSSADNGVVLGIQAVGQGVAELSAMFAHSIEMGARLEDIAGTIHAHPTLGEAVQEAALRSMGHAIHI